MALCVAFAMNLAWVFYCTDLGMLRVTDGLLSGLGSAVCLAENLASSRVLLYFQSTGLQGRGVIAAPFLSIKILPGWLAAGFNLSAI